MHTKELKKQSWWEILLIPGWILFIAGLGYLTVFVLNRPSPKPKNAPLNEFSAARAMKHIEAIAQKPHPTGSAEIERVRQYINTQLQEMGVEFQQQIASAYLGFDTFVPQAHAYAGTARNIIARIQGKKSAGAFLLDAHIDTVTSSPGAHDDSLWVAVLLETIRALKGSGSEPVNDLIFLFSDGEEIGLFGAEAFASRHPWARDVKLFLCGESGGDPGQILLSNTTGNIGVSRTFFSQAPNPVAYSYIHEFIYNSPWAGQNNLHVLKKNGAPGFVLNHLPSSRQLHSALDTPVSVSPVSLQQAGDSALALARYFSQQGLPIAMEKDPVFFNLWGGLAIHYAQDWVLPLTMLAMALCVLVFWLGFKRRILRISGILLGFFWVAASLFGAYFITGAVWQWIGRRPGIGAAIKRWLLVPEYILLAGGILVLALALASIILSLLKRWADTPSLAGGVLLAWLLTAIFLTFNLPGTAFLFQWPIMCASIAMMALIRRTGDRLAWGRSRLLWMIVLVPAALLFAPLIMLFSTGRLDPEFPVLLHVLLFTIAIPFISPQGHRFRLGVLAATLLAGMALIFAADRLARLDAAHPATDSIYYTHDADSGAAQWVTLDQGEDVFTSQFFAGKAEKKDTGGALRWLQLFYFGEEKPLLQAEAPVLPDFPNRIEPLLDGGTRWSLPGLTYPRLEKLEDSVLGDKRIVRLKIVSAQGTAMTFADWRKTPGLVMTSIGGRTLTEQEQKDQVTAPHKGLESFEFWAPLADGLEVIVQYPVGKSLKVRIENCSLGLPEIPGHIFKPRPPELMPKQLSDLTCIGKSFEL